MSTNDVTNTTVVIVNTDEWHDTRGETSKSGYNKYRHSRNSAQLINQIPGLELTVV